MSGCILDSCTAPKARSKAGPDRIPFCAAHWSQTPMLMRLRFLCERSDSEPYKRALAAMVRKLHALGRVSLLLLLALGSCQSPCEDSCAELGAACAELPGCLDRCERAGHDLCADCLACLQDGCSDETACEVECRSCQP